MGNSSIFTRKATAVSADDLHSTVIGTTASVDIEDAAAADDDNYEMDISCIHASKADTGNTTAFFLFFSSSSSSLYPVLVSFSCFGAWLLGACGCSVPYPIVTIKPDVMERLNRNGDY